MFVQEKNDEWLYTGDILEGFPILSLKNEPFKLISENQGEYSVRKLLGTKYCIYLSHDCDFNSNKRHFFLIAPLHNVPGLIIRNPDDFQKFKDANDVSHCAHYLNYFFIESDNNILETHQALDFTKMVHVPSSIASELVKYKKLQMNDATKDLLKMKIAHYFLH